MPRPDRAPAGAMAATLGSALAAARKGVDPVDARVLMTALLGCDAAHLVAYPERVLTPEQALTYEAWIARRRAGEPVAYIVGWREFYGRRFRVTPDVLIPRPETELLIDVALPFLRRRPAPRALDLGTGSGCIALTLAAECAGAHITAVDASRAALEIARSNAVGLGVDAVEWVASDWFSALGTQTYDAVLSNPPYIRADDPHLGIGDLRHEPEGALSPGPDGLAAIRRIVRESREHLRPGGYLWFEHGYDQGAACRELLEQSGYAAVETHRDIAGIERVTGGLRQA